MTNATPTPKSSWPLLTLAGLSFIPGIGFLIGAVALTWALLSQRPRARLAGILAATGGALNFIGCIVVVLAMRHNPIMMEAQAAQTRKDLTMVVRELERFHTRKDRYPATLQELVGLPVPTTLVNIYDHSGPMLTWSTAYRYRLAEDGRTYDLSAAGPDGKPDSDDDIRPVLPDSLLMNSGYHAAQ
jgi:hypothetical protein